MNVGMISSGVMVGMHMQITLTPSESKRLIAKGTLEYLKETIEDGRKVLVTRGSTNAYVLEEILKYLGLDTSFNKADFITGEILGPGNMSLWANKKRKPEVLVKKKEIHDIKDDAERLSIVQSMRAGDVVIKGANALDASGTVGVLVGDQRQGGTIGSLYGPIKSKGIDLLVPIGLEKMVWGDIAASSGLAGANECKHSEGMPCGLFPVAGTVMTEIDALELLFDVDVVHIASGGLADAQGSVALLIDADEDEELAKCKAFLEKDVLGEPVLQPNPAE